MFHRTPEQIVAREWARAIRRLTKQLTRGDRWKRDCAFDMLRWLMAQDPSAFVPVTPTQKDDNT